MRIFLRGLFLFSLLGVAGLIGALAFEWLGWLGAATWSAIWFSWWAANVITEFEKRETTANLETIRKEHGPSGSLRAVQLKQAGLSWAEVHANIEAEYRGRS